MKPKTFLKRLLQSAAFRLEAWGLNPRIAMLRIGGIQPIRRERYVYERQRKTSMTPNDFPILKRYPIYADRFEHAGVFRGHYFHQDLLVARDIYERNPLRHIDIGSSIYGFVSHVASFRPIDIIDIRPMDDSIPGIRVIQHDIMNTDASLLESTDSISCLHALEHFGLGRYNDPIDYFGWLKGLSNITAMLKTNGILYLSVPTGKVQRVEFNAHRVFSLPYLRDHISSAYLIEELAFVDDDGKLLRNVDPSSAAAESSFDATYGCSIWILRKFAELSVPKDY